LRVPAWLVVLTFAAIAVGAALGFGHEPAPPGQRLARAVFLGAGAAYLLVSLVDFWEHWRLEKVVTGRYLAFEAIPPGETLNHAATILVLASVLVLGRPPRSPLALRDWWVVMAPAAFLALGWRDELVYHRRRAQHREDIMHTVAHLAAAVMMAGFAASRLVDWTPL